MKTLNEFLNLNVIKEAQFGVDQKQVAQAVFDLRDLGSSMGQGLFEDIGDELAKSKVRLDVSGVVKGIVDKQLKYFEENVRAHVQKIMDKAKVAPR
jgi:hypothetical protein